MRHLLIVIYYTHVVFYNWVWEPCGLLILIKFIIAYTSTLTERMLRIMSTYLLNIVALLHTFLVHNNS